MLNELSAIRLKLIKLKNLYDAEEATLKKLDHLGGNLNLMEFEQLRMDHQIFTEKLEERYAVGSVDK